MNFTLLGLLMIGGLAVYAAVGVGMVRTVLHGKVKEGHNDVLVPIFLTAGVLYAVLLGFMVIAVWESYDAAKSTCSHEAATLVPFYRASGCLPKETSEKLHELARQYVEAVIQDEWPSQSATGKGSAKARRAMGNIIRAFGDGTVSSEEKKLYPFICGAVMNAATEVTNARNKRNIQANETLPWVMWVASIGGAVIVITMCFFIYMEVGWPHMLMASVMAALMGMLLFICVVLSHPFSGPLAIAPEAFENMLVVFDDVDKGN